jgi:hypothetical protein
MHYAQSPFFPDFCSNMRRTIVLLGIIFMFTASVYGQSPRIVRNPANMSSGGILNLIRGVPRGDNPGRLGQQI